jgi:hypothetical protein
VLVVAALAVVYAGFVLAGLLVGALQEGPGA